MIVPDVNLLVYATLTAFEEHPRAVQWWDDALNGTRQVGLAPPAIFGFLRITTNARILTRPMSASQAVDAVEGWLTRPQVHVLAPGPRHLEVAFGLIRAIGTAGNLTTDAQLAAFAIENQAEMHSNDADFGRFEGLRWTNPLR